MNFLSVFNYHSETFSTIGAENRKKIHLNYSSIYDRLYRSFNPTCSKLPHLTVYLWIDVPNFCGFGVKS